MDRAGLHLHIQRAWDQGLGRLGLFRDDPGVTIGLEERTPQDRYDWHGLRRGGDPQRPFVVCQYTLQGWGMYQDGLGRTRLEPGTLMTALIPGEHRYWLPAESPRWKFFYVLFSHTFAVELIGRSVGNHGGAVAMPSEHSCTAAMVRLFAGIRQGLFADEVAVEQAVVEVGFGHLRRIRELYGKDDQRGRMLAEIRTYLETHSGRFIDIEEIASAHGLSRSAYAHRFSACTGLSPASYLVQVRLDQVRRDLLDSADTLEEIAKRTGFADANHLCKVFRRHFHLSPGAWRKRMG